ncbi:MAG TPA: hypothetical protein GX708_07935 [Gallicola sp.]|nr:hypothetical protein [Gallicola sp.]
MSKKIFNTTFEVSMRLLILLDVFKTSLDEEKILYIDFFTIYSSNYGFSPVNLNGFSDFMINEFTSQRLLIQKSMKELVLLGLIKVEGSKDGFLYKINNNGALLCESMTSEYAEQYKKYALLVKDKVSNMTISELKKFAKSKEVEFKNAAY